MTLVSLIHTDAYLPPVDSHYHNQDAEDLYRFGKFLHRICGPHEETALLIHTSMLLYSQDITMSDSEDLDAAIKAQSFQ